jgi:hypothetical protein
VNEIEDPGVVAEVAEDDGGPDGRRFCGVVVAGHFEIEAGFLNAPDAQLPPARGGHGFNQRRFRGSAGVELEGEGGKELVEAILRFAFEDEGLGEHAVAGGVHGGAAFAGGGDRAFGPGSVGSGGGGPARCGLHSGFMVERVRSC